MKKFQSWNINFNIYIKIFKIKMSIFIINYIFWIEILIFGFKNISVEFKYQILDQISILKFKLKISCSNPKSKIQIMF